MASLLQAVARYGPRVEQGPHAQMPELGSYMARGSALSPNLAEFAIAELGEATAHFLQQGSPVVIPGLGRLRLSADRHGQLRLNFVADKALLAKVLDPDKFGGSLHNAAARRWSDADYKAAWDAEFPDDPLELPTPKARVPKHAGPGRPRRGAAGRK
jgi:hypothetical protein